MTYKIKRTTVKTEAAWHKLRDTCITASEAAVLVGLNPYSSPGKLKKDSGFTGNAYTLIGQVLEPVVVDVTNRVTGASFKLYETENKGKVFYTKGYLGATPDATDGTDLLECKSTKPDTYLKYIETPPMQYLTQLQVQLYCTDTLIGYLAILSTDLSQRSQEINWPIVIYKVRRSDKFCDILQKEAERFFTAESFRVCSATKRQAGVLLHLSYEKIHAPKVAATTNNIKSVMDEFRKNNIQEEKS